MKRRIVVFIMLATSTFIANAQFFVEWGMGVNYSSQKVSEGGVNKVDPTVFSFSLSPQAGYWLNEKVAVGTSLNIRNNFYKSKSTDPDNPDQEIEVEYKSPGWGISIFCRNKMLETGKFSFLLESSIRMDRSSSKENTRKMNSTSSIGIVAAPVILYDLTERCSIKVYCNSLSLSITSNASKDEVTGRKATMNGFRFNTQSTIFDSLTNINIGFIYNF